MKKTPPAAGFVLRCDAAVGAALDRVFAPAANPWRHLGALAFLCFVGCAASGVYLYAVFDTSLSGAYASGRALDKGALGSLVRGLHRYSADAFAVFIALHLLREAARGRFRAHRAWSWLSGLALVPLVWVAGITGFWLAWDERALFSAAATAEWLAAAPWHLASFARNFATGAALSDRFFSLVVFMHIGLPLITLAATWAHVQRLSHVRAWPPAALAFPLAGTLAALALAHPAASLGPADASAAPARIAIDWFYFFPHALAQPLTPAGLWGALAAVSALLAALPWIGPRPRAPAAAVDLARCNGCGLCAADCPYGAAVMVPRSDGRAHLREVRVVSDLCAGCGICVGACPAAAPPRRRAPLASGIELPQRPTADVRAELDRALEDRPGAAVAFACRPAGVPRGAIAVECAAMLPPALVRYALDRGAAKVVIAACRDGDCEHRLGQRWTRERFAGRRAPVLPAGVPRDRVVLLFNGSDNEVPHA